MSKSFLTKEEERDLIILGQTGDDDARNQVIENHLGFFYKHAKKVSNETGCDIDELVSVAVLHVSKRFASFNADKGFRFTTYFSIAISQSMWKYVNETSSSIYVSNNVLRKSSTYSDSSKERALLARNTVSLDAQLSEDSGSLLSLVSDESDYFRPVLEREESELLQNAISMLRDIDQKVVRQRLKGVIFDDIAQESGFSRQRAKQIFDRAVKELKTIVSRRAA